MTKPNQLYVRIAAGIVVLIAIIAGIVLITQSNVATVEVAVLPTATSSQPTPTPSGSESSDGETEMTLQDVMIRLADDDPYYGPEDAPVMIIEFSDYLCPWCGKFYFDTLPQILEAYPDQVRYIHRDYPVLGMFDADAPMRAAVAAGCAKEQGYYWEMHTALFEPYRDMDMSKIHPGGANASGERQMPDPEEMKARQRPYTAEGLRETAVTLGLEMGAYDACTSAQTPAAEVQHDLYDGQLLQISSVPTYIINGMIVQGAQSFEVFSQIIEQALVEAPLS